jgi:hypothetical protein
MKKTRLGHENKVSATGSGRIAVKTVEAPLGSKAPYGSAAGKVNLQPPMQPISERFPALEEQEIMLTVFAPQARQVSVAGNFNNWLPAATPMKDTGTGEWVVRLMLKSGQYEYRYVIDGLWSEDHRSSERVANPYGSFNSVLKVPLSVRTSIL